MEAAGAARRTPYEVVFGGTVFEEQRFPAIAAELDARGTGADPGAFVMLGSVGELLRSLRTGASDTPNDAVLHYGALAFQAFHFHSAGHPVYTVDADTLERLIALPPIGAWTLRAPTPSGYLQLPRNRLWVGADATGAAEPVDGFFWTLGERRLDLVLCTGLRPDRPGLGAIDVAAPLPADPPGHWGDLAGREDGEDFANILPGGELDGLHGITTAAEALKLASRAFWLATERARPTEPVRDIGAGDGHGMPPSAYPARPIRPRDEEE